MAARRDYSYLIPGYKFPVSNIECTGYHYERRDAPTIAHPEGHLRHYVMVRCPFCNIEFDPITQQGPRTLCCKKCSYTHKRPFGDPRRTSDKNHAEKLSINIKRVEDLSNQYFGDIFIKSSEEGKTDKFGMVYWKGYCACGDVRFYRSNVLKGTHKKNGHKRTACPNCLARLSNGEYYVQQYFKKNNIEYDTQITFPGLIGLGGKLLRFDFGIKNNNKDIITLIEFQGEQHYHPIEHFGGEAQFKIQQEHDNRKRQWCKEHNIKLIEIPYNYKNLDDYLNEVKQ